LASLKAELESRSGGGSSSTTSSQPTSTDTKDFKSNNIFKVKVPTSWREMDINMLSNTPYGDKLLKDLKEGFDKAMSGQMADVSMVIHHHALGNEEYREFVKGEEPKDEDLKLKRVGNQLLLKRMGSMLPGASAVGEPAVLTPDNGPKMAELIFKVTEGDTVFVVTRFCMASLPNLHLMSFVCREADYETQRDVFYKVAKSFSF
jgi:hypothetical protein